MTLGTQESPFLDADLLSSQLPFPPGSITQNLDVHFWKAFWNITEIEVLSVSIGPNESPNLLQNGDTEAQRPNPGHLRSLQGSRPRDGT